MSTDDFDIPNDISDFCRVCLQLPEESQYLDLSTIYDEEDNLTYGECFTICTQIDLNAGNGVPHHLCKSCGIELQMSYDFHKKILESNRVIEQCQRQLKEMDNTSELVSNSEQSKHLNFVEQETDSLLHIIDEKFVISYNDEQHPGASKNIERVCDTQEQNEQGLSASIDDNEETNEMEIINDDCSIDIKIRQMLPDNKISTPEMNENFEDHFEIEALEEEETETLQIKCGESVIPIEVRKYKAFENDEYVVYAEDFNEEKENETHPEEKDNEREQETDKKDRENNFRWQENVVAVANKEHLPIEIEGEEETVGTNSKSETQENQITVNYISQDEVFENFEEEEEVSEELSNQTGEVEENSNKNVAVGSNNCVGRKRHVGSYTCDYCHRVYPNYCRMKTHRRCHETNRPKFSCSHCSRMYATKQARDCHVQTAHYNSGYTCHICNKVFAIRKSLEIHVRYHTGDFPFACQLCDRKFAQVCHLNTHINVKHNKIRFSCEYPNCGKFFTSSSSLRNHEYTHSIMPFECEFCDQGYPAKSKLRVHVQRKHGMNMSSEQLEKMRVFHVMRSKVNVVQFVDT